MHVPHFMRIPVVGLHVIGYKQENKQNSRPYWLSVTFKVIQFQ